jgi:predicted PurR-regulated permease PerM
MNATKDSSLMWLVVAVSLAFAWILWPFYGAVLWATVTAIIFTPLYRRLRNSLGQRRNLAAFATVLIIVVVVILPLTLLVASVLQEAYGLYASIEAGDFNLGVHFRHAMGTLPTWASELLDRLGLTNLATVQERLLAALARGGQFIAAQAINVGQSTVDFVINLFVMLYLLFFLLRDGDELLARIKDAVPLSADHKRALLAKFTVVIRATVKGDVIVAVLQGALGGLIFWLFEIRPALLWGALMAVLALLPVVGTGLVWVPAAIYLLVTGAIWKGVVLVLCGVLIISLVDNLLRPVLIGKDTKMPDYVVLISTLGGIAAFGLHGFVIGPVIAAMFIAVWDIYSAWRQDPKNIAPITNEKHGRS